MVCLFPVWPEVVKKIIFYLSYYLLVVMIGFIIVRLVVFFAVRVLGWELWILPNFFDDNLPFLDCFKPFISSEKCSDGWIGYVSRVLLLIGLILTFTYVY